MCEPGMNREEKLAIVQYFEKKIECRKQNPILEHQNHKNLRQFICTKQMTYHLATIQELLKHYLLKMSTSLPVSPILLNVYAALE